MNSVIIQFILLAGVAVFLILKLKSVLGTREGFEKPVERAPQPERVNRQAFEVIEGGPDLDITDHFPEGSADARALGAMKRAEPDFVVEEFLKGARQAYEMILMAFERGELEDVRPFLAPQVFEAFDGAVAARRENGLEVTAEFLGLRELVLQEARFDEATGEAELTVRFGGELISSARDMDGNVVEGDPKAPRKQRDVWTFARSMGEDDPNWLLVATGG